MRVMRRRLNISDLRTGILPYVQEAIRDISGPNGEWAAKGFIDLAKRLYPIPDDTKVISKVLEVMLAPTIARFAKDARVKIEWCPEQNYYPDVTFIANSGTMVALDMKSAYRISDTRVSGFTLGAFTGYFRERNSSKNCVHPYSAYSKHYVLGIIYTEVAEAANRHEVFSIDDMGSVLSVIRDLEAILHEKYRIASDRPGSGNTKNIGSCTDLAQLRDGTGPFAALGAEVFDEYWKFFLTKDMARQAELSGPPYKNLEQYLRYRGVKR
jgi:hypothetical protein